MERDHHPNIVLIGMPGAGKSTVGVILAKQTARAFVDTDLLIQISQKKSLQNVLDERGYMALRRIEEQILLSLNLRNHVIATGGSAAYSSAAMGRLKSQRGRRNRRLPICTKSGPRSTRSTPTSPSIAAIWIRNRSRRGSADGW
jgi:hypothetical protein